MPSGERGGDRPRPRARGEGIVVAFPRVRETRLELAALVPSGRVLLLAFAVFLAGVASWWLARESSLFAVRHVEVVGAPPRVSKQVERAVADEIGGSLVRLNAARIRSRVLELPTVRAAAIDRAFPNTLRIMVAPERPVAVIRQRSNAWLVARRGTVIEAVERRPLPRLPRIWVPRTTNVAPGSTVTGEPGTAAATAAMLRAPGLSSRVATIRAGDEGVTLKLRSGLEVRLGPAADIGLKLRVAARLLPLLQAGDVYLDISLPERPVAGTSLDPQVEVEIQPSSGT
jgi:cell division septal protein FtsQ